MMQREREAVSVIIPAYNEEMSIGAVIEQIRKVLDQAGVEHELVVVDDGSTDQTSHVAQRVGAHVLRHSKNRGYGASLKTGIKAAKHDVLVITDADGTYPAEYMPQFIDALQTADMIVGARVKQNAAIPWIRRPGKWVLRRLAQYITSEQIPDLNSGMRVFRRTLIMQYLDILSDKFSFTTTSTVAMLCDNYKIAYVPIEYFKRVGKSKIVPWDFVNFIILILRLSMLFNPLKVFVPVALTCMAIGGAKLTADIILAIRRFEGLASLFGNPVVSTTAVILLLAGLQFLLIGMMSDGMARRLNQSMPTKVKSHSVEVLSEMDMDDDVTATGDVVDHGNVNYEN